MFGISYVELILVLGIGSVILGPKDLPRVARAAGQATGRAAAYLTAARTKFASFAKETELDKLHVEMQQSMQQLQAIQSELRGNMSFTNPGPMARRALKLHQPNPIGDSHSPSPIPPYPLQQASAQQPGSQMESQAPRMQSLAAASSFAASAAASAAVATEAAAPTRHNAATQSGMQQQRQRLPQQGAVHQQASSSDMLQPLPVSAVALGKAPSRLDSTPTGSDILLDALHEQEVAHHAQQFLNTDQGQAMLKNDGTRSGS